jgi:hypothetical protein
MYVAGGNPRRTTFSGKRTISGWKLTNTYYYSRERFSSRHTMLNNNSSSIFLALLLFVYPISAFPGETRSQRYAPGEVLVKFREGLSTARAASIHRAHGFKAAGRLKRTHIDRIVIPDGWSVEEAVSFYTAHPDVDYAEPNYIRRAFLTPNDPHFNELWGLHNTGQTDGTWDADIDALEAWDIQTDCSGLVIAVLDTGADLDHEDLGDNIWKNMNEDWIDGVPGNDNNDNDGNGKIDDYYGWDFVNEDNDPDDDNSTDEEYHGTHVTGIIAAWGDNGVGITGVCWSASTMQLKMLDSWGDGTVSDECAAIEYAIDSGATIMNLSFGGADYSKAEYDALQLARDAGVLAIAAAGNEDTNNDDAPIYPASYDLDNIISVTATDDNDELPSWANYGITSVDVAAPGVDIYSTKAGDSYQYTSGSSMATPHVVGLAALLWATNSTLTYSQVKALILNGVDIKSSLEGIILSGGRINAQSSFMADTLAAPANLFATAVSTHQIDLSWNDISYGESGFEIERRQGSTGAYTLIGTTDADTESFSDMGLQDSSVYFYRARAYKHGINSGYSREAHAPAAPSGLSVKWVSASQIDLSWQDNSSHEAGFKIERKTGYEGGYAEIATVNSDVTSYSDTGLSMVLEYLYRVQAYHAGGISLYSNEAISTIHSSSDDNPCCFIATAVHCPKNHP